MTDWDNQPAVAGRPWELDHWRMLARGQKLEEHQQHMDDWSAEPYTQREGYILRR